MIFIFCHHQQQTYSLSVFSLAVPDASRERLIWSYALCEKIGHRAIAAFDNPLSDRMFCLGSVWRPGPRRPLGRLILVSEPQYKVEVNRQFLHKIPQQSSTNASKAITHSRETLQTSQEPRVWRLVWQLPAIETESILRIQRPLCVAASDCRLE